MEGGFRLELMHCGDCPGKPPGKPPSRKTPGKPGKPENPENPEDPANPETPETRKLPGNSETRRDGLATDLAPYSCCSRSSFSTRSIVDLSALKRALRAAWETASRAD